MALKQGGIKSISSVYLMKKLLIKTAKSWIIYQRKFGFYKTVWRATEVWYRIHTTIYLHPYLIIKRQTQRQSVMRCIGLSSKVQANTCIGVQRKSCGNLRHWERDQHCHRILIHFRKQHIGKCPHCVSFYSFVNSQKACCVSYTVLR